MKIQLDNNERINLHIISKILKTLAFLIERELDHREEDFEDFIVSHDDFVNAMLSEKTDDEIKEEIDAIANRYDNRFTAHDMRMATAYGYRSGCHDSQAENNMEQNIRSSEYNG